MKVIDYLFFGIYNSYYKDGNYKNDIPWYTAMMIFGAMFFLNVSLILSLLSPRKGFPVNKPMALVIGGCCVLLSYFLFVWKKRYVSIYETYSKYNDRQKVINKVLSWLYFIGSIILFSIPPLKQLLEK
jgi:hypothetical protein